jgi:trans-aconitate 2-methyltransferase
MASWDPRQYLKFADHRLRPALDLLARIPPVEARTVYDLGCGPGNITGILAERWPAARVIGVDSSADMLAKARRQAPDVEFVQADLADWSPPQPAELVFSNATFQWLGHHERLFPRLMSFVAPGGVLAVQMPRNFAAPTHRVLAETVEQGPWRHRLRPLQRPPPVAPPQVYHRLLAPLAAGLDIWEVEYLQRLEGVNPVVEWNKGTALRPFLDVLEPAEHAAFLADYGRRIAAAYPPEVDGATLFPFRRLFIIAVAAA